MRTCRGELFLMFEEDDWEEDEEEDEYEDEDVT